MNKEMNDDGWGFMCWYKYSGVREVGNTELLGMGVPQFVGGWEQGREGGEGRRGGEGR